MSAKQKPSTRLSDGQPRNIHHQKARLLLQLLNGCKSCTVPSIWASQHMTQMVSIDAWSKKRFISKQQGCSCNHKKLA